MGEKLNSRLWLVGVVAVLVVVVDAVTTLTLIQSAAAMTLGLASIQLPVGIPLSPPADIVGTVGDLALSLGGVAGLSSGVSWIVAAVLGAGALIAEYYRRGR